MQESTDTNNKSVIQTNEPEKALVKQSSVEYNRSTSLQDDTITNSNINVNLLNKNKSDSNSDLSKTINLPNYCFRSPSSIESVTAPSPAGSIEQFDVVSTPLSVEDTSDSYTADTNKDSNQSNLTLINNKQIDLNNPNFRFRRHSSQSSINLTSLNNNTNQTTNLISPLTLTPNSSNYNNNERGVCSSPINSLKMSSRVCQIKIDEGIELHLSREIKSERETQNTLKLKSSCDELMLNNDDLDSFSFTDNKSIDRINTNSPNGLNLSLSSNNFKRYRTFSESMNNNNNVNSNNAINQNIPSPSVSSQCSYSNSSSPTGGLFSNNTNIFNPPSNSGLLRCFSPSTSNNLNNQTLLSQSQIQPNYFSQSPSPTRKLFLSRRSMSPVPLNLRPSSLNTTSNNLSSNNKRKISDVDQYDANSPSNFSPKRFNTDSQQEFVQPLLIYTGNNPTLSRALNRSAASSPSSPSQNSLSLIMTTQNNLEQSTMTNQPKLTKSNSKENKDDFDQISDSKIQKIQPVSESMSESSKYMRPAFQIPIKKASNDEKYTFVPIQLPSSSSSTTQSNLFSNNDNLDSMNDENNVNNKQEINKVSNPTTLTTSTNSSFSSLVQSTTNNNKASSSIHPCEKADCDNGAQY